MSDVEISSETEVSVSVGDSVTIRLPENATTGYVWSVDAPDEGLVVEDDLTVPDAEAAPGGGGQHVTRLRVRQAGVWSVHLRLAREWESQPLEERRLVVTVA